MQNRIDKVMDTYKSIVEDGLVKEGALKYNSYVVTNLRGGVGKSTLSFNLAFEMSRTNSLLVADLCPQCNLTETILHGKSTKVTIFSALQPRLLGKAFGEEPTDISYLVSKYCEAFKGGKKCYFIPGDAELFGFPSELYQQLQLANTRGGPRVVRSLLLSLKEILAAEADLKGCDKTLMDVSPFYAGGTHLAWCAADALIIPVRVDEHSIESLELTLKMIADPTKDYALWNERAGGMKTPKVAAIVMTMVGSKSQKKSLPDAASRMYIERAIAITDKYKELFDAPDPCDVFVITDDFLSSGRISGAESIPISELQVKKFHSIEGKRLQVNTSVNRYKKELKYLTSIL